MDFAFSEEQIAIRQLMSQISKNRCTPEELAAAEKTNWFHSVLWQDLAGAGLLGLCLPEEFGGSGLGFTELCILLEEHGKSISPIPLWPTLNLGALALSKFGTHQQQSQYFPALASGEQIITAALQEPNSTVGSPLKTHASQNGSSWVLTGEKTSVPSLHLSERLLVPARTEKNQPCLFIVDVNSPGTTLEKQTGTNGEPLHYITFENVEVPETALLEKSLHHQDSVKWLIQRATIGLCAVMLGMADRALKMTARYVSERHQFERPIGTFQAVSQRAGDAYIDVESMRMTMWRACWRLEKEDFSDKEVAVAKSTASLSGHRVLNAAQHLHGGMGFDRDYPLYRYFLHAKQYEFTLGSYSEHIHQLGQVLATNPPSHRGSHESI